MRNNISQPWLFKSLRKRWTFKPEDLYHLFILFSVLYKYSFHLFLFYFISIFYFVPISRARIHFDQRVVSFNIKCASEPQKVDKTTGKKFQGESKYQSERVIKIFPTLYHKDDCILMAVLVTKRSGGDDWFSTEDLKSWHHGNDQKALIIIRNGRIRPPGVSRRRGIPPVARGASENFGAPKNQVPRLRKFQISIPPAANSLSPQLRHSGRICSSNYKPRGPHVVSIFIDIASHALDSANPCECRSVEFR